MKINSPHFFLTPEELTKYDGSNPDLPLYLAIAGKVIRTDLCLIEQIYDVSAGRETYGPEGSYHGFAGRDASRSFLDLCFTSECLSKADDLSDLNEEEAKGIQNWIDFYDKHAEYSHIGYVKKSKTVS